MDDRLAEVLRAVERVERKVDALIAALAAEEEVELPDLTLDGLPAGGERNQDTPL